MTNSIAQKGHRLRLLLNHAGVTQKKMAETVGVTQGYITGIINGYKDLSGTVLEGLAENYGSTYNIAWLLTGKGEMLLESRLMTLEEKIDQLPVVRAGIVDGKLLDRIDNLEREVMLLKIKYDSLKNN